MKIEKKYRERLEMAADVLMKWRPSKSKAFDMAIFIETTDCGTICCAAGYLGLQPWFRRRGFVTTPRMDEDELRVEGQEVSAWAYGPLADFFGVGLGTALTFFGHDPDIKRPQEIARRMRAYLAAVSS